MPPFTASLPSIAAIVGASGLLAIAVLAGIKALPNAASVGAGGRDGPWRLRPSDVTTTSSIERTDPRAQGDTPIPEERRVVRVVYPGLTAPR